MASLSDRETELLATMVGISKGDQPLEIQPGSDTLDDHRWPSTVVAPSRDEIRALAHQEFLVIDRSAAPAWRFWPSAVAREQFSSDEAQQRALALTDPDARLGVILDAIVAAFEKDPATPLLLIRADQVDLIRHPHWGIEPDVVRMHDLRQLEDLQLIGWDGTTEFFPSPRGRTASKNPAAFLAQRADETQDEEERSRLRRMADKLRAGDVAVGTAGGLTGAAIRAALGL